MVNCDTSPSKSVWLKACWGQKALATEELYDLVFDPQETHNLVWDRRHEPIAAKQLGIRGGQMRFMLASREHRHAASPFQSVRQEVRLISRPKPSVRQPEHPIAMRPLSGQQADTAGRASGAGEESLAEQRSLFCELLEMRRRNSVAIGLYVAPCIVRLNVQAFIG